MKRKYLILIYVCTVLLTFGCKKDRDPSDTNPGHVYVAGYTTNN